MKLERKEPNFHNALVFELVLASVAFLIFAELLFGGFIYLHSMIL